MILQTLTLLLFFLVMPIPSLGVGEEIPSSIENNSLIRNAPSNNLINVTPPETTSLEGSTNGISVTEMNEINIPEMPSSNSDFINSTPSSEIFPEENLNENNPPLSNLPESEGTSNSLTEINPEDTTTIPNNIEGPTETPDSSDLNASPLSGGNSNVLPTDLPDEVPDSSIGDMPDSSDLDRVPETEGINIPIRDEGTSHNETGRDEKIDHRKNLFKTLRILERKMSKDILVKIDGLDIVQSVESNLCIFNIITTEKNKNFILTKESTDLFKHWPKWRTRKFKEHYGIRIGKFINTKGAPQVIFKTKGERNSFYKDLRELYDLCNIDKDFKIYLREKRVTHFNITENSGPFIGRIPSFGIPRKGKVSDWISSDLTLKVGFLDGQKSFVEKVRAIEEARISIRIFVNQWGGDEASKELARKLIEKKKSRVKIEMIIISPYLGREKFNDTKARNSLRIIQNLRAAGIEVRGYPCSRNYNLYKSRTQNKFLSLKGDYRNFWIFDSERKDKKKTKKLFSGNLQVSDKDFGLHGAGQNSYRGMEIVLRGRSVSNAQNFFKKVWDNLVRPKKDENSVKESFKCFNPFNSITQSEDYKMYYSKNKANYLPHLLHRENEQNKKIAIRIEKILTSKEIENGTIFGKSKLTPLKFLPLKRARFISSIAKDRKNPFLKIYLDLISQASREILLASPSFNIDRRVKLALRAARLRGVEIKVLINHSNFHPLKGYLSESRSRFRWITESRKKEDLEIKNYLSKNGLQEKKLEAAEMAQWTGYWNREKKDIPDFIDREMQIRGEMISKFMIVDRKIGINSTFDLSHSSQSSLHSGIIVEDFTDNEYFARGISNKREWALYQFGLYFFNDWNNFSIKTGNFKLKEFIKPDKLKEKSIKWFQESLR